MGFSPNSFNVLVWIACVYRWVCRAVLCTSAGVSCMILWVSFYIESDMESNLFLAVLSYVPIWVPLIPLVAMLPLALVFSRVALVMLLLSGLSYIALHCHPQFHKATASNVEIKESLPSLRIMSFNAGQSKFVGFEALVSIMNPDIVLLQEARGWLKRPDAALGASIFPHKQEAGEFVILSKFPFNEPGLPILTVQINGREKVCAYRHRLRIMGRSISIFNAHMPSPRELLRWHAGKGTFLLGLVHRLSTDLEIWHNERTMAWKERANNIKRLADIVKQESGTTIVAGDLNTPPWGGGYRAINETMTDSFPEKGGGYGFTFPAESMSLPSYAVPWLRIDYLFVSRGVKICDWKTSKSGRMQHLPICARITIP